MSRELGISQRSMNIRRGATITTIVALAAGTALGLSSCGNTPPTAAEKADAAASDAYWANQAKENDLPEFVKKCRESNPPHELPTSTNVLQITDTRTDGVYPCEYFKDEKLPINKPTNLIRTAESRVNSSSFTSKSSMGGFVLFGSGVIDGRSSSEGFSKTTEVVGLTFLDTTGAERWAVIDKDKASTTYCPRKCTPTVTFDVPNTELWKKGGDDKSIWAVKYRVTEVDDARVHALSMLSVLAPGEDRQSDDISGGPASTGAVISALVPSNGVHIRLSPDTSSVSQSR